MMASLVLDDDGVIATCPSEDIICDNQIEWFIEKICDEDDLFGDNEGIFWFGLEMRANQVGLLDDEGKCLFREDLSGALQNFGIELLKDLVRRQLEEWDRQDRLQVIYRKKVKKT